MPENNSNLSEKRNLDDIRAVLKYFHAAHVWDELDVQPGTNMVNIRKKGDQVEGIFNLINSTIKKSNKHSIFLGKSHEQKALVRQWVDYLCHYTIQNTFQSHKILSAPRRITYLGFEALRCFLFLFNELDAALVHYTFFSGHSLTICDILFYYTLYPTYEIMSFEDKEKYRNLSRWFALIQEDRDLRQGNKIVKFIKTPLYG